MSKLRICLVLQTIKDVNQSLVDDNLVESDRIGAGAFFWAFPSKGFQSRQNLIDHVTAHTAQVDKEIAELEAKLAEEKLSRQSLDGERDLMLQEYEDLRKQHAMLSQKIKLHEKCDPKRLEEIATNKKLCFQGMTRWTDNLYEMESWVKKNNQAMMSEEMYQAFPILRDLDYLQ